MNEPVFNQNQNPTPQVNLLRPHTPSSYPQDPKDKRKKIFYACNKWPECDFALWDKPFTILVKGKPTPEKCPECGKALSIRLGRNGRFIGCTDYPECKYTRNLDDSASPAEPETVEGRVCPECSSALVLKAGRYGKFIGCSGYPTCRYIEPLEKPQDTGVVCPQCKKGTLLKRKSRNGKVFYSCSGYPKCNYALWNAPIKESCPTCKWPILTIKETKQRGVEKVCPQKDCKYTAPYEKDPADKQEMSSETNSK